MPSNVRNFLISFCISAVFFSVIAFYAVQAIQTTIFSPDDSIDEEPDTSLENPDDTSSSNTSDETSDDKNFGGSSLNFVLIGTDYQPDVFDDYTVPVDSLQTERVKIADTILFVSFNTRSKVLILCPIPSQTRVTVDGATMTLGESYHYKGSQYICDKVSTMTGVPAQFYSTIDIQGLVDIIDYLGGLQYDVAQKMEYSDPSQNLIIDLQPGSQMLNGEQVLQMLRYNGYGDSDSSTRTALQGKVAYELLRQFANYTNKKNYVSLFSTLSKYLETNFTLNDLTENLSIIFGYNDLVPVEMEYPGAYTTQYFTPNTVQAQENFSQYFG